MNYRIRYSVFFLDMAAKPSFCLRFALRVC